MKAIQQLDGHEDLSRSFGIENPLVDNAYRLPESVRHLTLIAKTLSRLCVKAGAGRLHITYWHNDSDANQDLFYGYLRGKGENRSLAEVSTFCFGGEEVEFVESMVAMILYFSWDATLIDDESAQVFRFSNDGFVDYACNAEVLIEEAMFEFKLAGLVAV